MSALRQRCREIANKLMQDSIMRVGNSVDTLEAFVLAEKGRSADPIFTKCMPLVLYFKDEAYREEFLKAWHAEHPDSITKKMP